MAEINETIYLTKDVRTAWMGKSLQEFADFAELRPIFEQLTPKEIQIFWKGIVPFFNACVEYLTPKALNYLEFNSAFDEAAHKMGLLEDD